MKALLKFAAAVWLALAASVLLTDPTVASQGTVCMPTTGTVSGLTFSQDVNAAMRAVITSNSGASAPTNVCVGDPQTGQWWLDSSTSPPTLRYYDGTTWLPQGVVDTTNHRWTPPVGGGTAAIVSAATTDLWSVPQSVVVVSGSATITALAAADAVPGTIKFLVTSAAPILTYNATSLILPGAANISMFANEAVIVQAITSTNVRVIGYMPSAVVWSLTAGTGISLGGTARVPIINLANASAHTFKANATGGSAAPTDISDTTATAELNAMVGDSGSGGTKGLVPAPGSGDTAAGKYLKADGTWKAPPVITEWVSYVPVITGFGTVSGAGANSRRVGSSLEVRGVFTTGTASGVNATIGLKYNSSTSETVLAGTPLVPAGDLLFGVAVAGAGYALSQGGNGFVNMGFTNSGIAGYATRLGTDFGFSSGVAIAFNFTVPIDGWDCCTPH